MQYDKKDYKKDSHDIYKALTVKNPYATQLVTVAYEDNSITYAEKCIEVRSRKTNYRGDIMICSSARPFITGMESGVTLGFVELYDIKHISEFTNEDWNNTRIPVEKRKYIKNGYGWLMRNPRRVVEFPVKGQLGIYDIVLTKGLIIEYPRSLVVDKYSYKLLNKKGHE